MIRIAFTIACLTGLALAVPDGGHAGGTSTSHRPSSSSAAQSAGKQVRTVQGSGKSGYGHFAHPKYNFIYTVKDYSGGDFGHQEDRDGYRANGQYFVQLPDGRLQTVKYFTDEWGYHANVGYTGQAKHPTRYGPAVTFFKSKVQGGGGGYQ